MTKIKLERRTSLTHLKLEYIGNFSELDGVETINNQRVSEFFDVFLTRRLFLRVPQSEYYRDLCQNIGHRFIAGGGAGYYFIDKPKVEWLVTRGAGLSVYPIWHRATQRSPGTIHAWLRDRTDQTDRP